jgi:alpha-tubulin suppressor-like RCC1 family protein
LNKNETSILFQMDLIPRGNPTHIPIPKRAVSIAAGGHHSVVLAFDGEVFTFGNHQKGQLGREPPDEIQSSSASCSGNI